MPQRKVARTLQFSADTLFFLCFGAICVRMLTKGAVYINDMPAQPNNRAALLLGLVWLGVLFLAHTWMRRFAHTAVGRLFAGWRGAALGFLGLLAVQLTIALSCYTPCGWDPQVLVTTANDLLTGAPYTGTYFHQNPNNLFLLGGYRLFFAILNRLGITDYLPWLAALNSLLVWLSVLFLFLLVRRLLGARAAWLAFLLCAPMAACSPWIAIPYSDTFGMPFVIGSIYFYVMARETKRPVHSAAWAAACGAWLALGVRVKPTVLLIAFAAAVVEIICFQKQRKAGGTVKFQRAQNDEANSIYADENEPTNQMDDAFSQPSRAAFVPCREDCAQEQETRGSVLIQNAPQHTSRKNASSQSRVQKSIQFYDANKRLFRIPNRFLQNVFLRTLASILLGAIVCYGACGWFQQRTVGKVLDPARAEQEKFSATHYFMMGFSQPYGGYAFEDMQYTESIKGSDAKAKANLDEAARRVQEMKPAGYAAFLWRKLLFSWTDGTFFFGREGAFYWGEVPQQSTLAHAVQNVFRADQPGYNWLALWQQAQWILCLLLMLCGVFYRAPRHAKWFWFARVCTLGLVCFLLLFEARSRYVYHFVPILCFAALAGLLVLFDALRPHSPSKSK